MSDLDPLAAPQGPLPPEPPVPIAIAVEDQPPRDPFWTWGDFFVFLFLLLPCFVLAGVITAASLLVFQVNSKNLLVTAIPAQFLGYAFALIALWILLKTRYRKPLWRSLGWRWEWAMVIPMVAGGIALAIAVAAASVALKAKAGKNPMEELLKDPVSAMWLTLFGVTLGPVCEEVLFRGFMQPLAVRTFGLVAGIFTSALPFALLHGPQYLWSWQHILLILVAGCVFGFVRYKTGSTALAAVMHAGYNLAFFSLAMLQRGLL